MNDRLIRRTAVMFLVTVVAILALSPVGASLAQDASPEGAKFAIRPLDVDGSYFDIEMQPGETRSLAIELGNFGDVEAEALTYPADAFTMINGGMGVRNADDPVTGTTLWLNYAQETMTLAPGATETRTVELSVPADARPGEYLTTIVIQEAAPSAPDNATSGVTFNTLTRQAIAVAITVPGEMAPVVELGAAAHSLAGGNSVVSLELANSGNERVVLAGTFTLKDATGAVLTTHDVSLGAIYAGTTTLVEVPFSTQLNPMNYSASLTLADEKRGVRVEALDVPFVVEPPAQPSGSGEASGSDVAVVDQQPEVAPDPATEATTANGDQSGSGIPAWAIAVGAIFVVAAGAGVVFGLSTVMRRRHTGREEAPGAVPEATAIPETGPVQEPAPADDTPVTTMPARRARQVAPRRLPAVRKLSSSDLPGVAREASSRAPLNYAKDPSGDR